ncbi:MAG: hypothetical protein WD136_08680, partial [Cyanobium sp.]
SSPRTNRGGYRGGYTVPLLLGLLALLDLRIELRLLWDHFTLASLASALRSHPLAVAVLLLLPSLIKHYRSRRP